MAKKKVVVFDIDGCLLDCDHRVDKYERVDSSEAAVWRDKPIDVGITLARAFQKSSKYIVLFITSRSEKIRQVTLAQLQKYVSPDIEDDQLLMRQKGEKDEFQINPERMIKVRRLRESGYGPEDVFFAYEDRVIMVKAWRALGVMCLQPKESHF